MEAAGQARFGTLLRELRLEAALTQQELAERAKLSVEAISQLERGARTRPQRETVALLGRALNLSPERQAILAAAIEAAHPPRRRERSEALNPPLLRLIRSDPLTSASHNLPQQLTSFIGRQNEAREIAALLRENRIVTIVGAGGVGKTRVALQLAAELLEDYPDGVWLVALAPLTHEAAVEHAVLAVLQLPSPPSSALDLLIAHLKARRAMLILDNCEHVIARAREVAQQIAQACPQVTILATSREALMISAEQSYRLPSLAVPPLPCQSARDAVKYGAATLFADRARAVDTAFVLTDDNAHDVTDICRRLDGMPLAIELAAARVRVLAPRQIARLLEHRFRFLAGGELGMLPRHQTLTASLDWSYDLLTAREQRFFDSLSVFAGGCTLEAATAVCGVDAEDEVDVIELITSLVTKSLLVAELAGSEERYRLLESSRQYARDKLTARGDYDQVARRHAVTYLELAERLDRTYDTTPESEWLARARTDSENWRAALEWALEKRGDVILGERLAAIRSVPPRIFSRSEARHWVQAAVDAIDEKTPRPVLARLEHARADDARRFAEFALSVSAATRALAHYRELGDSFGIAHSLNLVGGGLAVAGKSAEAEIVLQDALEAARSIGDQRLEATVLMHTAFTRNAAGDFATARDTLNEALAMAKTVGTQLLVAAIIIALAETEFLAGDAEAALRFGAEALASARSRNSPSAMAYALSDMAGYLLALARYGEARTYAQEALLHALELKVAYPLARSLLHIASALVLQRPAAGSQARANHRNAARIFGFARAQLNTLGAADPLGPGYDRASVALRDALGGDQLTELMIYGASMTQSEAIVRARALERDIS